MSPHSSNTRTRTNPLYLATVLTTIASTLVHTVSAKQCPAFDNAGNLYLFGGSEDVGLGGSSSWASPQVTPLTTTGRPPFTGNNTLCLKGGYVDVLYVLDADSANPGDIYLFDFTAKSWSKQSTTSPPALSTGSSVLDHDTNVLFSLVSGDTLYTLDLGSLATATTAGSNSPTWQAVGNANFQVANPVMAQASQHIAFFGVPANPAGSANMFVVHYSYFQPEVQAFATTNGAASNFPSTHGVAFGVPTTDNSAGNQMVFIPDNASNTYLVTHWTNPSNYASTADAPSGIMNYINTTQTLAAPTFQDPAAAYAASPDTIVQLTSGGDIYYLSSFVSNYAASSSANWQKIQGYQFPGLTGTTGSSVTGSTTRASGSNTATGSMASVTRASGSGSVTGSTASRTASGTGSASSAASTGAASSVKVEGSVIVAAGLGMLGLICAGILSI